MTMSLPAPIFDIIAIKRAINQQHETCRTCGAKVPRPNYGTTGIENHLRGHHRKLYDDLSTAKKENGKRKLPETIRLLSNPKRHSQDWD